MITVDETLCNDCELCQKICHEYCIDFEGGKISIQHNFCSTCAQCIAICPRLALSWNGIRPSPYNRDLYPGPAQLDELFRERRTIRDFKNRKIERPLLKEIVNFAAYAPTHSFERRLILLDDENLIQQMDRILYRFSARLYRSFYRPGWVHAFIKAFAPSREYEYLKAKPKLEAAVNRKRNFKTRPAAVVMVIGDRRVPLNLESAQYALYNIDLYAQSRGLGCRNLVGNQMFLNRSKSFRRLIGLKKREKILGTLALGYPAVRFRNKVNGKYLDIQWNNEEKQRSGIII